LTYLSLSWIEKAELVPKKNRTPVFPALAAAALAAEAVEVALSRWLRL
jgi:hypothetical protein